LNCTRSVHVTAIAEQLLRTRFALLAEGTAPGCKPGFKAGCAIAIVTGPAPGAIQILAAVARVRVLNLQEIEVLLPVRTFFLKRRGTVANCNPLNATILELTGFSHISEILISGHRASAKGSLLNGTVESFFLSGRYFRSYEIAHR
jgi:hypothetical protein